MNDQPGEHLPEEPQSERGSTGSRDTGSDEPAGGPVDRPAGSFDDDEVTSAGPGGSNARSDAGPGVADRALPPYEGRREAADADEAPESRRGGARTAGATAPLNDAEPKAAEPTSTERGEHASPADEQPAATSTDTDLDPDMTGPAHEPGTGRAEDLS
jgi:hypothetical protein